MREGSEISRYYDPMISKLIVHAETRAAARQRMLRALEEYEVAGVRTNIPFCRHILSSEQFAHADFHTRTVDNDFVASFEQENRNAVPDEEIIAAGLAQALSLPGPEVMANHRTPGTADGAQWTSAGRRAAMRGVHK